MDKELNEKKIAKGTSIIVDIETHSRFKTFCKNKGLKVGFVVEDLLQLFIDEFEMVRKLIETNKTKDKTKDK